MSYATLLLFLTVCTFLVHSAPIAEKQINLKSADDPLPLDGLKIRELETEKVKSLETTNNGKRNDRHTPMAPDEHVPGVLDERPEDKIEPPQMKMPKKDEAETPMDKIIDKMVKDTEREAAEKSDVKPVVVPKQENTTDTRLKRQFGFGPPPPPPGYGGSRAPPPPPPPSFRPPRPPPPPSYSSYRGGYSPYRGGYGRSYGYNSYGGGYGRSYGYNSYGGGYGRSYGYNSYGYGGFGGWRRPWWRRSYAGGSVTIINKTINNYYGSPYGKK